MPEDNIFDDLFEVTPGEDLFDLGGGENLFTTDDTPPPDGLLMMVLN